LWLIGTNAPGASPEARPSLICKPPRGGPADRPAGPLWEAWQIRTAAPLERFALIGMTLDANWPEWAATNTAANPSWPGGFKLSALRAAARRGLVRRIRIRNCGANGKIPLPHWTAAGVEAFPLMIEATDYTAGLDPKGAGPGRPAWIVEDVEIRDFHAWHGGYATAVMAKARHPPAELADRFPRRRAVAVRRCQVCGVDSEIGFGSAASAGIACYNDAAINVRLGLNHDTPSPGGLADMDLTNCVFLDVRAMANVGSPGWGPNAAGRYAFRNYQLSGNLVRLAGIPLLQNYRSFAWRLVTIGGYTAIFPLSDPRLSLGRFEAGVCVGVKTAGADDVEIRDNWFTTRPLLDFYDPAPGRGTAATARWTPVWRPRKDERSPRGYNQQGEVRVSGLEVSSTAMDFTGLRPLPKPVSERPDLLPAIEKAPSMFQPAGRPGRAAMEFDQTGRLVSVREVQLSRPEILAGGRMRLTAREVRHSLPRTGGESVEIPHAGLRLRVERRDGVYDCAPVAEGLRAVFEHPLLRSNEWARCVAYEAGQGGFDPNRGAWAWVEAAAGQVVRLARTPDVGDDWHPAEATLRIRRSSDRGALRVFLAPVVKGAVRPATPGEDYILKTEADRPISLNPKGVYEVNFPDGVLERVLRVVPLRDRPEPRREYEAAWFRLLPNGDAYAIAPPERGLAVAGGAERAFFKICTRSR